MAKAPRITVSVISDLVSDQRVHKVCTYLQQRGYAVTLIGRCFKGSPVLENRPYKTSRILCFFNTGVLQYAEFNLKLLQRLLFKPTDLFLANDLDTLVPNYLVAFLRRKKLVYDSHEYFTGTPELQQKPLKRKLWKKVEATLLPKLKQAYTVNASIAALYGNEYGIAMKVVRNVPPCELVAQPVAVPSFEAGKFILLLQGAGINKDRGAEELIESMRLLPSNFHLVFIGSGDVWENLQQKTTALQLTEKVTFLSKVPFAQLQAYTKQAHLGLSLDKPTCLNHQLSLPNKVFDYIHASVPVLTSNLVEVKTIVEGYNVGCCIPNVSPEAIADAVLWIYNHPDVYAQWKKNTFLAARDCCWEKETQVLDEIFNM